jgi:nitroreductase/NAD-dependent dihydropyrimidine dehydrogenase PreA subunit
MDTMQFTIEQNQCTFCGLCAKECPAKVISINKEAAAALIHHNRCIQCGHCGMICPVGAVRVDGKELPEYPGEVIEELEKRDASALTEHLIKSKRSVRYYNRKPLKKDDIEAVLRVGELSPTATNSRQVDAILIQGDEVPKTSAFIASILLKPVRFARSPLGRAVFRLLGLGRYAQKDLLVRFQSALENTIQGQRDVLFFKAPAIVILTYAKKGKRFGRTDCALAGQNMMLLAHSRGIGSCMIGFAEAALRSTALRKKVGVSPRRRIGLIFTLGYTDQQYYRYPVRADWKRPW